MQNPIEIPREITKYEAKLLFGLTARQCVYYALAIAVVLILNSVLKPVLADMALYVGIFLAIPLVLIGTIKIYGMPLEKFAIGYIKTNLIAPSKRKTKIVNQFAVITEEMETVKKDGKKKPKYKASKLAFK